MHTCTDAWCYVKRSSLVLAQTLMLRYRMLGYRGGTIPWGGLRGVPGRIYIYYIIYISIYIILYILYIIYIIYIDIYYIIYYIYYILYIYIYISILYYIIYIASLKPSPVSRRLFKNLGPAIAEYAALSWCLPTFLPGQWQSSEVLWVQKVDLSLLLTVCLKGLPSAT